MSNLALTAFALVLVLLNGFFVAAEFAIVKLRAAQAEEFARTHGLAGRLLHSVRTHLDAYLSACQLGITLASLGLGWIGEPAFARLIEPVLVSFGVGSQAVVHAVAFSVAFAIIAFLHIVVGELAPKSLAIRRPEAVSLLTATPLWLFYWLMYPFIRALNGSANLLLRSMGVQLASEGGEAYSSREIRALVAASHTHGELDPAEAAILVHGLELDELTVGDVMRPFGELTTIDVGQPLSTSLPLIRRTRYSRYPVFEGERTHLIGLLHMKDLMISEQRLRDIVDLRPFLRDLRVVGENDSLLDLLKRLRKWASHFAAVINRQGTIIGFVTLEHVFEALVGPIEDEFSAAPAGWSRQPDGSMTGSGALPLASLETLLAKTIPITEVHSVGGLVIWQLGRLPNPGERVAFDGSEIEVLRMDGPRILELKVTVG
ncbi:MAG: HlyC/CorC family transporter [Gammaproteobacteria bacterium]|nr:HlyC/CorC family transporter [Gammaproteobacteria bacterium]